MYRTLPPTTTTTTLAPTTTTTTLPPTTTTTTTTTLAPISVTLAGSTESEDNGSSTDDQCFQFLLENIYYEGDFVTDAVKVNGRWFVDAAGTNPWSGGFLWYGVGRPETTFAAEYQVQISDAGIVVGARPVC